MHRYAFAAVCVLSVLSCQSKGQTNGVERLYVSPGTVLTFHLQTRLNPQDANAMDRLPKGTAIEVKILDAIDSRVDRDGSEFRGAVVSSVLSGNEIIVHPGAEVRGLLALLRSRRHPEGFRYELLLTGVKDGVRSYDLTASLNSSVADVAPSEAPSKQQDTQASGGLVTNTKVPEAKSR